MAHCDEIELWSRYLKQRDDDSRNALAVLYAPLVRIVAKSLAGRVPASVTLDELVSAGNVGLLEALAAFDPGRGVKFATYCRPRIFGEMQDYLRSMDWVPRGVRGNESRIARAAADIEHASGREPTAEQIAERLGITVDKLQQLRSESPGQVHSLDAAQHFTDSGREVIAGDLVADAAAVDVASRARQMDALRVAVRGLGRQERLIIILRYWEGQTLREIGQTLGVSESRVSQVHSALVARLQESLKGKREELEL